MGVVSVLRDTLVFVVLHSALACQNGEVIEAKWTDGTWRKARIVEVQDGPGGTCGRYRLSWQHTHICEGPRNMWDDGSRGLRCFVSRESIRFCRQELCRRTDSAESSDSVATNESSDRIGAIIALSVTSFALLLICVRVGHRMYNQSYEFDEEKATDVATPVGRGLSWTPKSMNSSPVAKWTDKMRKAAQSSSKNEKILTQPEPAAAAAPTTKKHGAKLQFVDQMDIQAASWRGRLDNSDSCAKQEEIAHYIVSCLKDRPGRPPVMVQTPGAANLDKLARKQHGAALRHAAWVHTAPLAPPPPPQAIRPPLQLPTLLHQTGKSSLRKKPPLQGVPPQEPTRKGPTKNVTWDQELGLP